MITRPWPAWTTPVAALAAGTLLATAGPPFNVVPALWLGLAALALVLEAPSPTLQLPEQGKWRWLRALRVFAGGGRGLLFGMAANTVALRFIPAVVTRFTDLPLPVALLALVLNSWEQGFRWALLGIVYVRLRRLHVRAWAALPASMYLSTFVPVMIPWTPAGGAGLWLPTVQLAEIVGERGVDVVMALVAGLAVSAWLARPRARPLESPERAAEHPRRWKQLAAASALVFAGTFLYGMIRIRQIDAARAAAPHTKVALVAPAFPAKLHDDPDNAPATLARLQALTHDAESKADVDFSVWPEGIYPWALAHEATRSPAGGHGPVGPRGTNPVLTGLSTYDTLERSFNSAAVFDTAGNMSAVYDKMHLLWFGETVPLAEELPWLASMFSRGLGMSAGTTDRALVVNGHSVAVMNCFEDTLSLAAREAGELDPTMLVNITQDGWFSGTTESELHMRIAHLRSVETRRDLVRSVNGGMTSWYDATGRLRATWPEDEPGYLVADVALLALPRTPYVRFGEWPLGSALAGLLVLLVFRTRRRLALAAVRADS